MNFEDLNLNTPLLNAIQDLGFSQPTPIQEMAFSVIMSGKDVVGIAQTGTGKTLAYLLPLLRQLKYSEQRHPRILIMVPTRELVIQVVEEAQKLATYMNVKIDGVYGGANINTQTKRLYEEGVDVLVATPGRLYDLAMQGTLRLKSVQKLVIDEVDEMLNLGFRPQLISLLEILPEKRQTLMFSATLADEVEELIRDFFRDPQWVDVNYQGTPLEKIRQKAYHVPNFGTAFNLLCLLLEDDEVFDKVLVFAANKKQADKLYHKLTHKFPHQLGVIHSNKSQNQRFNTLDSFQDGLIRILISTDLVARGVDLFEVSHVINFGLPEIPGTYIHRIGRTGRAEKEGEAIAIVTETNLVFKEAIEEFMQQEIPVMPLPDDLVFSNSVSPEEHTPTAGDKAWLKPVLISKDEKAFHDKKAKNKKVNLGGPGRKARMLGQKTKKR